MILHRRSRRGTMAALRTITAHREWTETTAYDPEQPLPPAPSSYGPLSRVPDLNTGREILALPPGFRYATFNWTGARMTDGTPNPVSPRWDGRLPRPGGHGLIVCEDDVTPASTDAHALAPDLEQVNRLVGLTHGGVPFEFAVNLMDRSELAGVCFSPDASTMFVNIYGVEQDGTGCTCAITGPWGNGPL